MKKILKRKKTLIILGACIAILGLTFGTVSIAQNSNTCQIGRAHV